MRYIISIASIRKSAVDAATNPATSRILLAMVLAPTLCLVGFADAERHDDDPLEETAASTSEGSWRRQSLVPARSSECDACGKMSA